MQTGLKIEWYHGHYNLTGAYLVGLVLLKLLLPGHPDEEEGDALYSVLKLHLFWNSALSRNVFVWFCVFAFAQEGVLVLEQNALAKAFFRQWDVCNGVHGRCAGTRPWLTSVRSLLASCEFLPETFPFLASRDAEEPGHGETYSTKENKN